MTRALPRPHLHSTRLVRLLAELASTDFPATKQSFAEKLGSWLDVPDAITLSATLHPHAGHTAAGGQAPAAAAPDELGAELARVRDTLRDAIVGEGTRQSGRTRLKLPIPGSGENPDATAEFAPYHRYYVAHQRDMDAQITTLRASVRAALARRAPDLQPQLRPQLRELALLDAALDKALNARERSLLSSVPLLLEKRFAQLRAAQAIAQAAGSPPAEDPERSLQPGGWLARFHQELQQLLLAELDLRLQPVSGLVEAYRQEVTKHP